MPLLLVWQAFSRGWCSRHAVLGRPCPMWHAPFAGPRWGSELLSETDHAETDMLNLTGHLQLHQEWHEKIAHFLFILLRHLKPRKNVRGNGTISTRHGTYSCLHMWVHTYLQKSVCVCVWSRLWKQLNIILWTSRLQGKNWKNWTN